MAEIHEERLREKIAVGKPNECWLWTGGVNYSGHGIAFNGERTVGAHRWTWELAHGAVPDGLCVLHACDVPACCNPTHLFLGTQTDNMRDKCAKGRHKSPWAKLTREQAAEIISSGETIAALAKRFRLSTQHVSQIRNGRSWAWLRNALSKGGPR